MFELGDLVIPTGRKTCYKEYSAFKKHKRLLESGEAHWGIITSRGIQTNGARIFNVLFGDGYYEFDDDSLELISKWYVGLPLA